MDIKEAAEQAMSKETEFNSKVEIAVKKALEGSKDCCSSLYQIPEDSDCLKDINEMSDTVTEFIKNTFANIDEKNAIAEKEQSIQLCASAINMLEKYRSVRLNIDVAGKFKYETLPNTPKVVKAQ